MQCSGSANDGARRVERDEDGSGGRHCLVHRHQGPAGGGEACMSRLRRQRERDLVGGDDGATGSASNESIGKCRAHDLADEEKGDGLPPLRPCAKDLGHQYGPSL